MNGAGAVTTLVLLEATVGLVAGAAWTQSWAVVRRGHFRIAAWTALALAALGLLAARGSLPPGNASSTLFAAVAAGAALYLFAQYVRSEVVGTVVGAITTIAGVAALFSVAQRIDGWPAALAWTVLLAGAALVGAVTNGLLLGHWYLNQPGLKPWALARLTALALAAVAGSAVLGVAAAGRLAGAATPGAALGLQGFGESFGAVFFWVWLALVALTGAVAYMARRCVQIRSIQSATGLFYVAVLSAGVAEFLSRYLMLNARG